MPLEMMLETSRPLGSLGFMLGVVLTMFHCLNWRMRDIMVRPTPPLFATSAVIAAALLFCAPRTSEAGWPSYWGPNCWGPAYYTGYYYGDPVYPWLYYPWLYGQFASSPVSTYGAMPYGMTPGTNAGPQEV